MHHTGTTQRHPTTYFCKITVRKSKYCLILKLQTGLNFWMTDNFRFLNASLHQTSKFHHHPSFEIVHFHFANFQGSIDKIPIWKKNANAYESCQWNCLSCVNMQKEDCFKSLTISFPARRSHGLLGMILIKSIYASVPIHTITQKLIFFMNYRLLVVCPWKWW